MTTYKALNGLLCADVPLRNYSFTHSRTHDTTVARWSLSKVLLHNSVVWWLMQEVGL